MYGLYGIYNELFIVIYSNDFVSNRAIKRRYIRIKYQFGE